jgi:hypothetical protein
MECVGVGEMFRVGEEWSGEEWREDYLGMEGVVVLSQGVPVTYLT